MFYPARMMFSLTRRLLALAAMAAFLLPRVASAQAFEQKPVVAVFDIAFEDVKFPEVKQKQLTKYLGYRLVMGKAFQVIPEGQLKEAMVALKIESQKECYDEMCRVKLGNEVAANKNLNVTVWKVGSTCSIMGALYDLRAAASEEATEVKDLDCSVEGLKAGIETFARQLGGKVSGGRTVDARAASGGGSPTGQATELPPPPDMPVTGQTYGNDAPPPVKAETGFLSVEGNPKGARVDIVGPKDFGTGGKAATSLPVRPFQVPAGQYKITVSMTDYDTAEYSARVYADATEIVKVDMVRSSGQVQISGKPEGAKSRLECQKGFARDFGLPVTDWTVTVPRGECHLTVERDGYGAYDERFDVAGGAVVRKSVDLKRDISGAGVSVGVGGIKWVRLPGGTFQMGSTEGASDEKPVHSVTLSAFEMAATEVTVGQYRKCVDAGACSAPNTGGSCNWGQSGREDHPVNCVDWNQATAYAKWIGGRLPTEAEWEYAARSGGKNQKYPWGDAMPTCSLAVFSEGGDGCGQNRTWPVCSKMSGNTSQGLCDMAGNVWEWVSDWYWNYSGGSVTNPTGFSWSPTNVARGGSWNYGASYLRAANRDYRVPGGRHTLLGFRLARSVR